MTANQVVSLDQLRSSVSEIKKPKKVWDNEPIDVVRSGTQIVLPEQMEYPDAITALQKKMREDETVVSIHEEINAFPLEGAYALCCVLKDIYGWATPVPTPGFFGPTPPTMVNLEIDYGVNTQVFWGEFEMPGIEGRISTGVDNPKRPMKFVINGNVKKKYQNAVKMIAEKVREFLRLRSIYKGKAIRLSTAGDGDLNFGKCPSFIDTKTVRENELVLPDNIQEQVRTSLFTPIEHSEACRKYSIPLKRGVLLEGPYGCGKTLTAYVTARKCVENNWTFIYLDRVSGLKSAFAFAKAYSPAVIFAEDIDRVTDGERDMELDDILNQIDGIELKNSEIITILTTNNVENIHKSMMRPGRLDAVINITAPDAKAAEKLIRIYSRGLLNETDDLTAAGKELEGQIPATIRESVERAKLYAISRSHGVGALTLKPEDVVLSAQGMKHHLELMQEKKTKNTSTQIFAKALANLISDADEGCLQDEDYTLTD